MQGAGRLISAVSDDMNILTGREGKMAALKVL